MGKEKATESYLLENLRNIPIYQINCLTCIFRGKRSFYSPILCLYHAIKNRVQNQVAEGVQLDDIKNQFLKTIKSFQNDTITEVMQQQFIDGMIELGLEAEIQQISGKFKMDQNQYSKNKLQRKKQSFINFKEGIKIIPTLIPIRKANWDEKKQLILYNMFLAKFQCGMMNLQRGKCLCGEVSDSIKETKNKKQIFRCVHCLYYYHIKCYKRKKTCPGCYLKYMYPDRQVKRQLVTGLLNKNKTQHQLYFMQEDTNNNSTPLLEIRSIRLVQDMQFMIMFQQAVTVQVNQHLMGEFTPLPEKSSAKYRLDGPIDIPKYAIGASNKCLLKQTALGTIKDRKKSKKQHHAFGIYQVQYRSATQLVQDALINKICNIKYSLSLLENNFKSTGEDIQCQDYKISLTCPLSKDKIKYPARGIFCRHFQCFDLFSFISFVSKAMKWVCPICKLPAYTFFIDPILLSILQLQKNNEEITHAMFQKDGGFVFYEEDKMISNKKIYLNELPSIIEQNQKLKVDIKRKRLEGNQTLDEKWLIRKKLHVEESIPDHVNVLELDD